MGDQEVFHSPRQHTYYHSVTQITAKLRLIIVLGVIDYF